MSSVFAILFSLAILNVFGVAYAFESIRERSIFGSPYGERVNDLGHIEISVTYTYTKIGWPVLAVPARLSVHFALILLLGLAIVDMSILTVIWQGLQEVKSGER